MSRRAPRPSRLRRHPLALLEAHLAASHPKRDGRDTRHPQQSPLPDQRRRRRVRPPRGPTRHPVPAEHGPVRVGPRRRFQRRREAQGSSTRGRPSSTCSITSTSPRVRTPSPTCIGRRLPRWGPPRRARGAPGPVRGSPAAGPAYSIPSIRAMTPSRVADDPSRRVGGIGLPSDPERTLGPSGRGPAMVSSARPAADPGYGHGRPPLGTTLSSRQTTTTPGPPAVHDVSTGSRCFYVDGDPSRGRTRSMCPIDAARRCGGDSRT